MMIHRARRVLFLSAIALALNLSVSTAAQANTLDPRIAYALSAEPGGVVTSASTVEWPRLGMTLTLPSGTSPRGLSSKCPTGLLCAFGASDENGARLTWATSGTFATTALAQVRSVANARPTGTVQARNGTIILASAAAGNYANVSGSVTNVRCL